MYTNENDINNFKCYNEKGEKIITKSEYIIVDYLSLLNEHFFEKNKYSITYISLPVFMMIKKNKNNMWSNWYERYNNYWWIFTITMYYGYTKDYDLFLQENKNNDII